MYMNWSLSRGIVRYHTQYIWLCHAIFYCKLAIAISIAEGVLVTNVMDIHEMHDIFSIYNISLQTTYKHANK